MEQGDDITRCLDKRTLVVVNHQSTADVPLLMAAFNAKQNVLTNITWIMDRMFRYTNFGVVSSYHRDFFIASVSLKFELCGGGGIQNSKGIGNWLGNEMADGREIREWNGIQNMLNGQSRQLENGMHSSSCGILLNGMKVRRRASG